MVYLVCVWKKIILFESLCIAFSHHSVWTWVFVWYRSFCFKYQLLCWILSLMDLTNLYGRVTCVPFQVSASVFRTTSWAWKTFEFVAVDISDGVVRVGSRPRDAHLKIMQKSKSRAVFVCFEDFDKRFSAESFSCGNEKMYRRYKDKWLWENNKNLLETANYNLVNIFLKQEKISTNPPPFRGQVISYDQGPGLLIWGFTHRPGQPRLFLAIWLVKAIGDRTFTVQSVWLLVFEDFIYHFQLFAIKKSPTTKQDLGHHYNHVEDCIVIEVGNWNPRGTFTWTRNTTRLTVPYLKSNSNQHKNQPQTSQNVEKTSAAWTKFGLEYLVYTNCNYND